MSRKEQVVAFLKEYLLGILILCGVLVGLILGYILQAAKQSYTQREIMYVGFLGEILLRMLKAVALPLMVCSLITAVGTFDVKLSGRLGGEFLLFIILTKVQVLLMAIAFALIVKPGSYAPATISNVDDDEEYGVKKIAVDGFLDIIRNIFPQNVIEMSLRHFSTVLKKTNDSSEDLRTWEVDEGGEMLDGVNIIGVVSVSIFVGIALALMQENGLPLLNFFECFLEIGMLITLWIMWIAPICLICSIAKQVLRSREYSDIISDVGVYLGLLIGMYIIQLFIVLPLIYFAFVRKCPYKFMWNFGEALSVAFGTASSTACIPLSIKCLRERGEMDPRLAQFVVSAGAIFNKDGAAIFYCFSTIFIAQLNDRYLTFGELVIVTIMSFGASITANTVLSLALLFSTFDLPLSDISIFLALDWFSDRFQTPVNIFGNAVAAAVLNVFNKHLFEPQEEQIEIA